MRSRHVVLILGAVTVSACSSGGAKASFAEVACPVVMRWADDAVTAVNEFQEQSPTLADAGARRTAYLATFDRLDGVANALAQSLDAFPYPTENGTEIHQRLATAISRVHSEYDDDRKQATDLPDSAFAEVGVNDGKLFTGNEKAKAIVFETVGKLWQDFDIVDENCGRHPPVTVDLDPG